MAMAQRSGMVVWAIIPIKPIFAGKTRLARVLSPSARAALIGQFLQRTLTELRQVSNLAQIMVVSGDPAIWTIARSHGVLILEEERPLGLNSAITQAVGVAAQEGANGVLILPVDLPFLQAAEVQTLLDKLASNQPAMIIAGDGRSDGTNALLISPPDGFTFHYGPGSFSKHLEEANCRNMTTQIVQCPGLQFDLDTENDWQIYQRSRSQMPHESCRF